MLTREQFDALRAKGLTVEQIVRFEKGEVPKSKQSALQEVGADLKQTAGALKNTAKETMGKIDKIGEANVSREQGYGRSFLQSAGAIAGGVAKGIGDVVTGAAKAVLFQDREDKIKEVAGNTIKKIAPIAVKIDETLGRPVGTFIESYQRMDEKSKRDVDALLGISSLAFEGATAGATKKLGQKTVTKTAEAIGTAAKKGEQLAVDGLQAGEKATGKIIKAVSAKPLGPIEATKQVLQAKPDELKKSLKGLSAIDTDGVETFAQLNVKIRDKISELAKQVDTDLAVDTSKKILDDLTISAKTKNGAIIKIEPAKNALQQLEELYDKTGDAVKLAEVKDMIVAAKKEGLSKFEINNLSRIYGSEFGSKAFSKMGDPLTSVNAQLFENTRKSLKTLAREGLNGEAAKIADEAMSDLYELQRLTKKNLEAVNKLQQKIQNRGPLEKVGHALAKYGDILTGGTIRGLVGGLLPRGAGYKVMNALDIEQALKNNLKIIQDAINSKGDEEIMKILGKLPKN